MDFLLIKAYKQGFSTEHKADGTTDSANTLRYTSVWVCDRLSGINSKHISQDPKLNNDR